NRHQAVSRAAPGLLSPSLAALASPLRTRRYDCRSGRSRKSLRHSSPGFAPVTNATKPPQSKAPTFRLTRVTRIFQKSVFTEATPAARAGCRAGFFVARRASRAGATDDVTCPPPHPRMPTSRCRPPVAETGGHCFATVLYNESTYHSVWRRRAVIVRNPVSCRPGESGDLKPVIIGPCLRRDDDS